MKNRMRRRRVLLQWLAGALALSACDAPRRDVADANAAGDAALPPALAREMSRLRSAADSVDAIFQPLPLLRPAAVGALRRFGNDAQLAAARRLGVAPDAGEAELAQLLAEGALVRLADSTDYWVVRRLDHSAPYLTPDAEALLREVGARFHRALAALGAPRFRVEVTSVLRTAADQAQLRRTNPNAAAGASTHQYGTTFDVGYNAFAAPTEPITPLAVEPEWLGAHLREVAAGMAETIAARRSRELMAVLGKVLLELQQEGAVMVTLEELQPVFHLTVARRLAPGQSGAR